MSKPKFKVGDKVVINKKFRDRYNCLTGVGTVVFVDNVYHNGEENNRKMYSVRFADKKFEPVFYSYELDLYPEVIWAPFILAETVPDPAYYEFMDAYHKAHEACPRCGNNKVTTTLMGFAFHEDRPENYKDRNICTCSKCGWRGIRHDMVPKQN